MYKAPQVFTSLLLTTLLSPIGVTNAFSFVPNPQFSFHSKELIKTCSSNLINFPYRTTLQATEISENNNPESATDENEIVFATDPKAVKEYTLTSSDKEIVNQIYQNSNEGKDEQLLEAQLMQALPSMPSGLILVLRKAGMENEDEISADLNDNELVQMRVVGKVLEQAVDVKMQKGKDLLAMLLECGEIRKLDAAIGKAARGGELDMAFFTVLNMNVADAYQAEGQVVDASSSPDEGEGEGEQATRLSILQHIYTRCQEELEKTLDPGIALLNKLLRTSIDSIRYNQLQHYLGKPKSTITAPDGKEIQLKSAPTKSLVSLDQFIQALANAVTQIRQVENAGGTDRTTAANLVENCRQVAIEARLVIGEEYGRESDELREFEDQLQPIFRPTSA